MAIPACLSRPPPPKSSPGPASSAAVTSSSELTTSQCQRAEAGKAMLGIAGQSLSAGGGPPPSSSPLLLDGPPLQGCLEDVGPTRSCRMTSHPNLLHLVVSAKSCQHRETDPQGQHLEAVTGAPSCHHLFCPGCVSFRT